MADGVGESRAAEDYLKAVFKHQRSGQSVSTSVLAGELGRSAASVTNMVKSLADRGLLEHVPYHGVRLTAAGEREALRIVRRHRVLEAYLIEKLGYGWDRVHEEAERLEHAASDQLIDRMAREIGEPAIDPHGAPIPTRDGRIAPGAQERLSDLEAGAHAIVREVSDDDPESLRALGSAGLFPGARVVVGRRAGPGEPVHALVDGEERIIDRSLAAAVGVERVGAGPEADAENGDE
ncbi:MAG: metal-dependent transcriptional regulator [Gemmatimonadota bacterium]